MNKTGRLKKNTDFQYVYKVGKSFANSLIVMYIVENEMDCNKAGFSVSKKVGKSVIRNKIRRRLKECYRLNSKVLKKGYNIVFIARSRIKDAAYLEIEKAMLSLFEKANIIDKEV